MSILTDDEIVAVKRGVKLFDTNPWAESRAFGRAIEAAVLAKLREQEPADSYDEIWNALQRIDSAAVTLPTFSIRHEGGLNAFTQNIVDAIMLAAAPQPAEGQAPDPADIIAGALGTSRAHAYQLMREAIKKADEDQ